MKTISFTTHVGEDGILQISLPENIKNADLEITLVYQPILAPENQENNPITGWTKGFFEEVIGGWEAEELVREKQPDQVPRLKPCSQELSLW